VLDVERWAELRREHFVRGVSIKELMRRTGLARNTIRAALRSQAPPTYERSSTPSKLDPFKDEIHALLRSDPKLPWVRVRELVFAGARSSTSRTSSSGRAGAQHLQQRNVWRARISSRREALRGTVQRRLETRRQALKSRSPRDPVRTGGGADRSGHERDPQRQVDQRRQEAEAQRRDLQARPPT
jgi:hypothetical protein